MRGVMSTTKDGADVGVEAGVENLVGAMGRVGSAGSSTLARPLTKQAS